MGGGVYCYADASLRSAEYTSCASVDHTYLDRQVFTKRSLDSLMDIKGKIRESRDSAEHPNAFPIIIALDVTGSMGNIPKYLIIFNATVNRLALLIFSLLGHRNTTDFCILILHLSTLPNYLMSSYSFLVASLVFSI